MRKTVDKDPFARLYPGPRSAISKFAIAASVLPLGLFVFSLLGRHFFFAELIGNFRCQILFMLIPGAVMLLGLRLWWLAIVNLIAIAWCMVGVVWVYIPLNQPAPGNEQLKVMSFNVLGRNSDHERVVSLIEKIDPDVLTILE